MSCSYFSFCCQLPIASAQKWSSPPEREVDGHSDRDGGFCRSALRTRNAGNDQRSCSRSCGRSQTPCRVPPSARRLAGEPQTATFRPSPNTPSKASLPPLGEEVSPMCPVQTVTHVSGRSLLYGPKTTSFTERAYPVRSIPN